MRVAWLSYLDPFHFDGGGEMHNRLLIEVGRERGHEVAVVPFLRHRVQRALRRTRLHRGVRVDWDADLFVLANIRNVPGRRDRFPERTVRTALRSGRAAVLADAWVDVCPFDMPCGGVASACRMDCDRSWANRLYGSARIAIFVSPMQKRMTESVLDVPLPKHVILSRPQIDVGAFAPMGLERDIDVLYVGTINESKGYRNLVDTFGSDRLTFAGRNMLAEPVAGNYLGRVKYEKLPGLYNRARTFAHLPEWYEPMGRTVVEANLCGCEIVTNDKVGVTSYPDREWQDRELVGTNATRLWEGLEQAMRSEDLSGRR